ncbi:MAG TPA: pirin family protein [Candidatus Sulfotelmatobacter sp.]|jgi:redox-sensitive bicupin YhaK (pirin superfamily)|nr:pirin family protein [Candidatus Sulfotelmatobacter sp.]
MPIYIRPSAARGHANHGWLDTWHSFSFANYYDPRFMGYRSLRVINEDVVAADSGFPTHGHQDMEIITYIIRGELEHRDSTGGHSVIRRGEVQRMSAGTGIRHSEMNPSPTDDVKLLQIWLLPEEDGIRPGYEQSLFSDEAKTNRLCPVASPGGRDGALTIRQDVTVYASILEAGKTLDYPLAAGRGAWVQMVEGKLEVNGQTLSAGDAAAVEGDPAIALKALEQSEFLLFDLG